MKRIMRAFATIFTCLYMASGRFPPLIPFKRVTDRLQYTKISFICRLRQFFENLPRKVWNREDLSSAECNSIVTGVFEGFRYPAFVCRFEIVTDYMQSMNLIHRRFLSTLFPRLLEGIVALKPLCQSQAGKHSQSTTRVPLPHGYGRCDKRDATGSDDDDRREDPNIIFMPLDVSEARLDKMAHTTPWLAPQQRRLLASPFESKTSGVFEGKGQTRNGFRGL